MVTSPLHVQLDGGEALWQDPSGAQMQAVALTCKVGMERGTRLELATVCLEGRHSTN